MKAMGRGGGGGGGFTGELGVPDLRKGHKCNFPKICNNEFRNL
jgi:hypothetical protein